MRRAHLALPQQKTTERAISILLDRARDANCPASARQVAARIGISQPLVVKIVCRLVKAGLLTSQRGAQGGFRLARPAGEITIGDVVRAIDRAPAETHALDVDPTFAEAGAAFNRILDRHRITDIERGPVAAASRKPSRQLQVDPAK